jgi:hypothetical protein
MARKPRQKTLTLAQRRANPGLRAKLPMSQLTPAQQAQRKRNQLVASQDKNPLYDPTTQLAGHSLIQAAQDLADTAIKPKVDAYNRQITSATTQGTALASRAGDYYTQLAAREMQGVASQKALADLLNSQTASIGQQSQQAFAGMSQAEQARQAQDAALRGTGLSGDSSARVGGEIAAQQGTAATLQQAGANTAAQSGSSWANLSNAMNQARQLRGGEVQGELLNRLATQQTNLRQQIADTESQRGDLTSENLTKLRQQAYENLVTNQGLNIKQQDLQNQLLNIKTDAATATANRNASVSKAKADRASRERIAGDRNRLSDRQFKAKYGLSKRQQAERERHNQALENKPGAGSKPKPATQAAQSTFRRDASSALAVANALKGKRLDRHKAAAALTAPSKQFSKGLDPVTASVALDVAYDGHISQYNVDRLHKAGIAVNQLPWPTRRQFERRRRRSSLVAAAQGSGVRPLTSVPII